MSARDDFNAELYLLRNLAGSVDCVLTAKILEKIEVLMEADIMVEEEERFKVHMLEEKVENLERDIEELEYTVKAKDREILALEQEQRETTTDEAEHLVSLYTLDRINTTPEKRVGLAESLINDLTRIMGIDLCSLLV